MADQGEGSGEVIECRIDVAQSWRRDPSMGTGSDVDGKVWRHEAEEEGRSLGRPQGAFVSTVVPLLWVTRTRSISEPVQRHAH
eukprot:357581-Chlamydomonas_euryale.AAC.4